MNVNIKTCGCGNQWRPMSKLDTRCWKCLRKDAESIMQARSGELMPSGRITLQGDRAATGVARPALLRVPLREPPKGLVTPSMAKAFKDSLEEIVAAGHLDRELPQTQGHVVPGAPCLQF